jgi:hypothetical protein
MSKYLQPGESIKIPGKFVPFKELVMQERMRIGEERARENRAKKVIWVYGPKGWENWGHPGERQPKNFGEGLVAKCLPVGVRP